MRDRIPHAPHVRISTVGNPNDRGTITRASLSKRGLMPDVRLDIIARLEQHQREDTLPRGPRGLFYDLRPSGLGHGVNYKKTGSAPHDRIAKPSDVTKELALMRRVVLADGSWWISENWIADGHAPNPQEPFEFAGEDPFDAYVQAIISQAVLARQVGQPVHFEIWCEAAALMRRVARIAEGYGVTVFSGGGFDGLKGQKDVGARAADRSVPTLVGHIGDRDRSGETMFDALAENGFAFLEHQRRRGLARVNSDLEFVRLALTVEQAEEHYLLDDNGKGEVDGLPVPVMDAIVAWKSVTGFWLIDENSGWSLTKTQQERPYAR